MLMPMPLEVFQLAPAGRCPSAAGTREIGVEAVAADAAARLSRKLELVEELPVHEHVAGAGRQVELVVAHADRLRDAGLEELVRHRQLGRLLLRRRRKNSVPCHSARSSLVLVATAEEEADFQGDRHETETSTLEGAPGVLQGDAGPAEPRRQFRPREEPAGTGEDPRLADQRLRLLPAHATPMRAPPARPRRGCTCSTRGASRRSTTPRERAALAWTEALTLIARPMRRTRRTRR